MPLYTKESLDILRQKIDLFEVLSSYIDLKRAGSVFKALCPFHEEKTPSFILNRGGGRYHCFGCGAHGDAIGFLMNHMKMGFIEAVENLAERFGVTLERENRVEIEGPSKSLLKEALYHSCRFYHFMLLYSNEGHQALEFLYNRGIDLNFIRRFEIGFAPKEKKALHTFLKSKGFSDLVGKKSGLLFISEEGRIRDFFSDRVMFPIRNGIGAVIGFSGRKRDPESSGGKYINTPETVLFKKSQLLFGLNYSRKKIIKEKKALIVEGQIDCLRLIQEGFDFTVSAQGTAFGEGHVRELLILGVQTILLALDGDDAGQEAAVKIGDLFQKKGVEVVVIKLPQGKDPDLLIREKGPEWFAKQLNGGSQYLSFLVERLGKVHNLATPVGKSALAEEIMEKVRRWEHPIMVHETVQQLAGLVQVPVNLLGIQPQEQRKVKKEGRIEKEPIDADKIIETDLLRLLFLAENEKHRLFSIAEANLKPFHFKVEICQRLYALLMNSYQAGEATDLLSCAGGLEKEEESGIILEIMNRKIQLEKAEKIFISTVEKLFQRKWMEEREKIKLELYKGNLSEEETLGLAKKFDSLTKQIPVVTIPL